jgi:hypothetical protein
MVIAADYPFLNILWTMIIFFAWVIWIWMVVAILGDVFSSARSLRRGQGRMDDLPDRPPVPRRARLRDRPGRRDGERNAKHAQGRKAQMDDYVRSVAGGGPAAEIDKARQLLDGGAINEAEYEAIKAKALA